MKHATKIVHLLKSVIKPGGAEKWLRITLAVVVMISLLFVGFAGSVNAAGAMQISGFADITGAGCEEELGDFALGLSGDLTGCNYVTVQSSECSPSGTYRERGTEYYIIVDDNGTQIGTFETTYLFTAKFEGCDRENGIPLGAEILGRCQHPIVAGSGTGVFEGVTGRLDYKDHVEINEYPYRGHLKW